MPMVTMHNQHFHVYKTAQLQDLRVVLPVCFYQDLLVVRAKCLGVTLEASSLCHQSVIMVKEEPEFDFTSFFDVDVEMFGLSFVEMVMCDGCKWADCPHALLHRECSIFLCFCNVMESKVG